MEIKLLLLQIERYPTLPDGDTRLQTLGQFIERVTGWSNGFKASSDLLTSRAQPRLRKVQTRIDAASETTADRLKTPTDHVVDVGLLRLIFRRRLDGLGAHIRLIPATKILWRKRLQSQLQIT